MAIDIKAKIEELIKKITSDKALQDNFQKEPVKTVEKLVDTILGRQVFKLHAISPLDPIPHKGSDKKLLFTEYPVDVDFEVAFEDLYIFFQSILEEDRVFFIRNMRIRAGTVPGAPLRVEAVLSSAIFE